MPTFQFKAQCIFLNFNEVSMIFFNLGTIFMEHSSVIEVLNQKKFNIFVELNIEYLKWNTFILKTWLLRISIFKDLHKEMLIIYELNIISSDIYYYDIHMPFSNEMRNNYFFVWIYNTDSSVCFTLTFATNCLSRNN